MFTLKKTPIQHSENVLYSVNSLDHVEVLVTRHGNDMYGNPLYRLQPTKGHALFFNSERLYRRYISKGYALIQSYNIDYDVLNILTSCQTIRLQSFDTIVPHFKLNYHDTLSYEFSIVRPTGEYYTETQNDQEYDTFRIFSDGSIYGTLSNDYYVYDHLEMPDYLDGKYLYKMLQKFDKNNELQDHTQLALEMDLDGYDF